METRLKLIADIQEFRVKSLQNYNLNHTVNKSEYLSLLKRMDKLTVNNFENQTKHKHFYGFVNQTRNTDTRFVLEHSFKVNFIEMGAFLALANYMSGIENWLR